MNLRLALAALGAFATFAVAEEALVDIPTTAANAGSFSTLIAALTAADLVGVLSGEGPFTVFAPSDAVFATLPPQLLTCLLVSENAEALTYILTQHVVIGEVFSTDITDGMTVEALNGENITITVGDSVSVNGANVVTPDIAASNGVIHVIDNVILPPGLDAGALLATCSDVPAEEEGTGAPAGGEPTDAPEGDEPTEAPEGDEPTEAPEGGGSSAMKASASTFLAALATFVVVVSM